MSSLGQTAIEVRGVSKRYKLGSVSANTVKKDLLSRVLSNKKTELESDMMALDDISFTVNAGEVFGIIGRNGAEKSTLLKIMSKITAPSSGTIKLMGRMASLLEVGTGFHPKLTGRENIFLNGAILGMTRSEIKAKFDEIVDFSGVENSWTPQ
jgi:lipopolysaccharide transport system ATP-binding protein